MSPSAASVIHVRDSVICLASNVTSPNRTTAKAIQSKAQVLHLFLDLIQLLPLGLLHPPYHIGRRHKRRWHGLPRQRPSASHIWLHLWWHGHIGPWRLPHLSLIRRECGGQRHLLWPWSLVMCHLRLHLQLLQLHL